LPTDEKERKEKCTFQPELDLVSKLLNNKNKRSLEERTELFLDKKKKKIDKI
jgi:hypothetical protein